MEFWVLSTLNDLPSKTKKCTVIKVIVHGDHFWKDIIICLGISNCLEHRFIFSFEKFIPFHAWIEKFPNLGQLPVSIQGCLQLIGESLVLKTIRMISHLSLSLFVSRSTH